MPTSFTLPATFKVQSPTPDGGVMAILVRAIGMDGLRQAKSRAKALSQLQGDIVYMVGSDEAGAVVGQIAYSGGRICGKAGCFAV